MARYWLLEMPSQPGALVRSSTLRVETPSSRPVDCGQRDALAVTSQFQHSQEIAALASLEDVRVHAADTSIPSTSVGGALLIGDGTRDDFPD